MTLVLFLWLHLLVVRVVGNWGGCITCVKVGMRGEGNG